MTEPPPSMSFHEPGFRKSRFTSDDSVSLCSNEDYQDSTQPMTDEKTAEARILEILASVAKAENVDVKPGRRSTISVYPTPNPAARKPRRKASLPATKAKEAVNIPKTPAFVCDLDGCAWVGKTRIAWRSHRIQKHPELKKVNRPIMCVFCPNTKINHGNMLRYRRHLLLDHGFEQFSIQKDILPDKEALNEWLENAKQNHSVKFVTWGSAETQRGGIRVRRYYCSMSGMVLTKSDYQKIGTFCTCSLKVSEKPDGLHLEYCLVHSGHEEGHNAEELSKLLPTPPSEDSNLPTSPTTNYNQSSDFFGSYSGDVNATSPEFLATIHYESEQEMAPNGPVYHDLKTLSGPWGEDFPSATEAMYYKMEEDGDVTSELFGQAQVLSDRLSAFASNFNSTLAPETHNLLVCKMKELSDLVESLFPEGTDDFFTPKRQRLSSNNL
ncbi:hypothetical protein L596_027254 [Steinernema carpocapsae]|uniref:Uncharacterized protein n=1 Tax=Steinernema carpocapsae TaxID=34508 RepID=A0A4U5M3T7_STECR|nr:hypothetical protein L596_027254 [Steinernema carpocapsae]